LTRQFNAAGINAACYTSDTKDDERAKLLADFKQRDPYTRVLVSVEALAKGFDVPDVGCVIDARPLRKSLSTAIQMWGRGLRSSPDTGKVDCLLLDFSGNIFRFADDFSRVYFEGVSELKAGEQLDKTIRKDEPSEARQPKPCPKCNRPAMGGKKCVGCGFEIVRPSLIEALPGNIQEIKLGGKILAQDRSDLWAQVATYARTHSTPENQQGRAAHLFKDITGSWPPREFQVATAPHVEPTKATKGKITSLNIARHSRRAS
jgi:superfamily II DNA/RNA helicase